MYSYLTRYARSCYRRRILFSFILLTFTALSLLFLPLRKDNRNQLNKYQKPSTIVTVPASNRFLRPSTFLPNEPHIRSLKGGLICNRSRLLNNGCCGKITLKRNFGSACHTCNSNRCCDQYEFCVSCCQYRKEALDLKEIIRNSPDGIQQLLTSAKTRFEFCLIQCRTSSRSVHHENSYRDSTFRFCYGAEAAELTS
ncbi:UPF0454 protein C12orf49 [Trichoplax sp. H2]|nr:UPF0454 protein C12orf49 [Trichoplax sp. H2]|eukprot:RDD40020.1 UPF0454 protein C12orf49 [Trichoplax sp. H2]